MKQFSRIRLFRSAAAMVLALVLTVPAGAANQDSPVQSALSAYTTVTGELPLDAATFPDAAFLGYVKTLDLDANGSLSAEERAQVVRMDVRNRGIASLQGLEQFPNLEYLNCNNNALTELDLALAPRLQTLFCNDNRLTALDVSGNPELSDRGIPLQLEEISGLTGAQMEKGELYGIAANGTVDYVYTDEGAALTAHLQFDWTGAPLPTATPKPTATPEPVTEEKTEATSKPTGIPVPLPPTQPPSGPASGGTLRPGSTAPTATPSATDLPTSSPAAIPTAEPTQTPTPVPVQEQEKQEKGWPWWLLLVLLILLILAAVIGIRRALAQEQADRSTSEK